MKIVNEIQAIAESLPGGPTFYYAGKPEHNANDDLDYTTGLINLLEYDELDFTITTTGAIMDTPRSFIRFLKKEVEFDDTAVKRMAIINEMRNLCRMFLSKINKGNIFQPVTGRVPIVQINNFGDTNLSGVEVQLNLTLIQPNSNCFV